MTLQSRSAAIRGDDYQHAIGWYAACSALHEPEIISISIEDAAGGHFDDIVIRRRQGTQSYWQAKSSNFGDVVVDESWLTTAKTDKGHSPLQHFYLTWRSLRENSSSLDLALITNRGFDHNHPLIGRLRDLKSEKINLSQLAAAGPRTKVGKARSTWCEHLGIDVEELLSFLADLRWESGGAESSWDGKAKLLMRLTGLRSDDEAVTVGRAMVRGWVTDGAGPQTRDDLRRQVTAKNLLARSGTLLLEVHAIDRQPSAQPPNVELDFVNLYDGDDSFNRLQLRNPTDWQTVVAPALRQAARNLEAYATRRVHIAGSMRLPLWFAIGRELPDVRRWVLSADQHDVEWCTSVEARPVTPRVLLDKPLDAGADIAFAAALTWNIGQAVEQHVTTAALPVGRLIVLGPDGEPGPQSVQDAAWASGWARQAREDIRAAALELNAPHVHLFLSTPAVLAMMLGHFWNLLPPTTVYEYLRPAYTPTLTIA